MHASFLPLKILFPGHLITGFIRARHGPIPAVFIHMGLDMAPRNDFLAALREEGTPYLDLVAHIY
jgi:hypothetical protein